MEDQKWSAPIRKLSSFCDHTIRAEKTRTAIENQIGRTHQRIGAMSIQKIVTKGKVPAKGAIIPAAAGVDIGCGMNVIRFSSMANVGYVIVALITGG